jgi:ketosteroid isomerase-like protein
MAEHPNVGRIRRGYDIRGTSTDFSDSDRAEIEDLFADDLVYHGQGTSRFAQDFRGRDQFFAVERQFAKTAVMRQEVRQIFADDVHAIVIAEVRAQHDGAETRWLEAEVFHFGPDGKVTDTWGVPEDQVVVDDFWASVMPPAGSP